MLCYDRKGKYSMIKKYYTITETLEIGAQITKVILETGKLTSEIKPEDFTVNVIRRWADGFEDDKDPESMNGRRNVLKAYQSDINGEENKNGEYVTLELDCHILKQIGSVVKFRGAHKESIICDYTVTSKIPEIEGDVFSLFGGNTFPYSDVLTVAENTVITPNLKYVNYIPDTNKKVPLIVWLHGMGEGGKEPKICANVHAATNFLRPWATEIFGTELAFLAPQSPTMWMDDGTGSYTKGGSSVYTRGLDKLIADFINENEDKLDLSRIYIGGDSNGGYMTLLQLMLNPDRYAAAFPICEALKDEFVSDEDIETIKNKPIWFTHSADDPIIPPVEYSIPTYKRLIKAGAENVHFTLWDKVIDLTGRYKDEEGNPHRYVGHFSWIYMLDNECKLDFDGNPVKIDGKEVSIMEWLASQHK